MTDQIIPLEQIGPMPIVIGRAIVCGAQEFQNGEWVQGWYVPGRRFVTCKAEATRVAGEMAKLIGRKK